MRSGTLKLFYHMKKTLINTIAWMLVVSVSMIACKEDEFTLGQAPSEADAGFTFAPSAENDNIINFTGTSSAFLKKWDFGNGSTAAGSTVTAIFPVEGTYTVTLTVYTSGGSVSSAQQIVIAETDATLLDIPAYNMLTGGNSALDGKTWVIDATQDGHFGVGDPAVVGPNYYAASANEKDGLGLYDDKFNFTLDGFSFTQITNGDVFINGEQSGGFPGAVANGTDAIAPFTAPAGLKWSITEDGDKQFLTISNGGFIGYYTGTSTYEILTLEENELFLRYNDAANAGLAWYLRLVPEGYVAPSEPEEPVEYKIEDIYQDFDGTGNVDFVNDSQASIVTYDNPAPVPINTSAKVGKYTKADGAAGEFGNVQIVLGYKMDIRDRNIFKLKVFIPGYNDYTTTGGEPWQSYNTLQKQVAVKLQNSDLGGNAYTTQAEVIHSGLETDKWLELTFDFSGYADREDFDKIVIQLGGEAIFTGGIFFIDELVLLP